MKNVVIDDVRFKRACCEYGLKFDKCEVYGEVTLVPTSVSDLYVILDENYNVISVSKKEHFSLDNEKFAKDIYKKYCTNNIMGFGFPFDRYSLKNFIDLSNRVDIIETNHGHSLKSRINGAWFYRESAENEEYFQLLSYTKFMGERIKEYNLMSYHMQIMGFEMPDVYSYARNIIDKINNCVWENVRRKNRTWPRDIINSIGLDYQKIECFGVLFDISDLLMREVGMQVKSGQPDELEIVPMSNSRKNFSAVSSNLFKLLDVPEDGWEALEENGVRIFKNKDFETLLFDIEKVDSLDSSDGFVLIKK